MSKSDFLIRFPIYTWQMDKRQVAKIEENLMIDNTLKIVWSDFYVNICITYPIFRYNLLYATFTRL